jgi:hypothetical protein
MRRTFPVRAIVLLAILLGAGQASCVSRAVRRDSGSDLRVVSDHLYLRHADLGQVGFVSISPSGERALFERNGDIYLIVARTGKLDPVTDGEFSMPEQVRWSEAEGFAEIDYQGGRPSSRIDLR